MILVEDFVEQAWFLGDNFVIRDWRIRRQRRLWPGKKLASSSVYSCCIRIWRSENEELGKRDTNVLALRLGDASIYSLSARISWIQNNELDVKFLMERNLGRINTSCNVDSFKNPNRIHFITEINLKQSFSIYRGTILQNL